MPGIAVVIGLLLVALGLVGYFSPDALGVNDPGKTSPTALIPAGVGALIALCGVIVLARPAARKHAMHAAAALALIGALGGFMPLVRSQFDFSKSSAVSGLIMIGACTLFVVLAVRSFILARMARAAGLPAQD